MSHLFPEIIKHKKGKSLVFDCNIFFQDKIEKISSIIELYDTRFLVLLLQQFGICQFGSIRSNNVLCFITIPCGYNWYHFSGKYPIDCYSKQMKSKIFCRLQFVFKKILSTKQWFSLLLLTIGCMVKHINFDSNFGNLIPKFGLSPNIIYIIVQVNVKSYSISI